MSEREMRPGEYTPALERLDDRTWPQLAAAVRVAVLAMERMTKDSEEARDALGSMARILSDDWDGQEGRPGLSSTPGGD